MAASTRAIAIDVPKENGKTISAFAKTIIVANVALVLADTLRIHTVEGAKSGFKRLLRRCGFESADMLRR